MGNNGNRSVDQRTIAEFALVTLIWGSTWLVIKGQLGIVPAVWSVTYRFGIASIVLLAVIVVTGRWQRLPAAGHRFAAVIGVAQFVLNFNLVYAAEARVTSGLIAVAFALLVVPNAIFGAIFLKSPVSLRFMVGAALGVAGVGLLFAPGFVAGDGPRLDGLLLVVGAVICASTANVMQATRLARDLPPLPTLALAMTYGTAINAIYALATAGPPALDPRASYWLGLAYLAVFASVVAFSVYYRLIRRIGAATAAYSSVVVPVVAMTLSTLFEDFRWTRGSVAGTALVIVGVVVALTGRLPPDNTAGRVDSPETPV